MKLEWFLTREQFDSMPKDQQEVYSKTHPGRLFTEKQRDSLSLEDRKLIEERLNEAYNRQHYLRCSR